MIVETVPAGEAYVAPAVAGRIGPETVESETTVASQASAPQEEAAAASQADQSQEATPTEEATATQEVAVAEPATEALATKEEQEKYFWAELELLGRLSQAEGDRIAIEGDLESAERREKELREELNELVSEMPELRQAVEASRTAILGISRDIYALVRNKVLPKAPAGESAPVADDATGSVQAEAPAAADPDEWMRLSTAELLDGVKGLGASKLTDICELAPTVGDLEELRAQASREHKQFKEKLPKGCGEKVANLIEDRLISHVAKFAKQATAAAGKPDTSLADDLVAQIRRNASDDSWRAQDCKPDDQDTDMTHQGRKAYAEGKPHTALPTLDPQLAHQWMIGWVCGEVIAKASTSTDSQAN